MMFLMLGPNPAAGAEPTGTPSPRVMTAKLNPDEITTLTDWAAALERDGLRSLAQSIREALNSRPDAKEDPWGKLRQQLATSLQDPVNAVAETLECIPSIGC